jgi:Tfp pilus assembly protein PilO
MNMKVNSDLLGVLRQRKVLVSAGVTLLVLLIWLVAVFNPEGHKLSNVNSEVQAAQSEQASLQARLDRLRVYSKESAVFEALGQRLSAAVPPTADFYDYITAISNAAAATHMAVSSISPGNPSSAGNVTAIPVVLAASGNYSQTLAFVKAIDALPRLTVITQLSISGGGTNSGRSTVLTDEFNMEILAQPSAVHAPSTSG